MIRFAITSDATAISLLHKRTLPKSFLAKLGTSFLTSLYTYLIINELVLVYKEEDKIKGFISFSSNSAGMMKRFLFSCPICVFKLMLKLLSSPNLFKRFVETFLAPFKSKSIISNMSTINLPVAELLSISVDPNSQQSGIGKQLLTSLEEQLINKGIRKYKVIAGASLESANKFYFKNRFIMVSQLKIHGEEISNIYVKELT